MVYQNFSKRFRIFYNKENFDYSTETVEPFKFHTLFHFLAKSFRVLDERSPTWTLYFIIIMSASNILGIVISFIGFVHFAKEMDIINGVQSGSYFIILFYKMLILYCSKYNVNDYQFFFKMFRKDFLNICTRNSRYRKFFFENQLQTWQLSVTIISLMMTMGCTMVSLSFLLFAYYFMVRGTAYSIDQPQLVVFWLYGVDFLESPLYEISVVYANYIIILYGYSYSVHIHILFQWIRHITLKADLVNLALEDIMENIKIATTEQEKAMYDSVLKQRMRSIVLQHISMYSLLDHFAEVYRKLFIFEEKIVCVLVCLTAYAAAEKLSQGEFHIVLIFLAIAIIGVAFIPCYMVDFLTMKVRSVCETCANVPFWHASGCVLRPYLVLMMQRSLQRLPLQQAGFPDTSLKTFSKTMTSAYSMFNMLRQADLDV